MTEPFALGDLICSHQTGMRARIVRIVCAPDGTALAYLAEIEFVRPGAGGFTASHLGDKIQLSINDELTKKWERV